MGYSAAFAVVSLLVSVDQTNKAKDAREEAAERENKARSEQKASQAQQAAQERRQQVREERIRRARVLQAGENTGTASSSGEFGALGSLRTQLNSNVGFNLGQVASAQAQGDLLQQGADLKLSADNYMTNAGYAQQIGSIGTSIISGYNKPKTNVG